jgi:hypothetical protein
MVSSGEVEGNFHCSEYFCPKLAEENSVSIHGDDSRRAMKFDDIVDKEGSHFVYCVGMSQW